MDDQTVLRKGKSAERTSCTISINVWVSSPQRSRTIFTREIASIREMTSRERRARLIKYGVSGSARLDKFGAG